MASRKIDVLITGGGVVILAFVARLGRADHQDARSTNGSLSALLPVPSAPPVLPPTPAPVPPIRGELFSIEALTPAGAANIGVLGPISFFTPDIIKGGRFEVKRLGRIAERAAFVDEAGRRIGAVGVERHTLKSPTEGRWFDLSPIEPLAPRSRYWLVIDTGDSICIRHEGRTVSGVQWRLPFTTAAPLATLGSGGSLKKRRERP